MSKPTLFPEEDLAGLRIHPARTVDLRRDISLFLRYVREHGLKRTVRHNALPVADVRRLAKIFSWRGEKDDDSWSDHVSWIAREMGLVFFDAEGSYQAYSSREPSYPDNYVEINEEAVAAYLEKTAARKEKAILDAHLTCVGNEFFKPALLLPLKTFDNWGSATGPAGNMDLPRVRRDLLAFLDEFKPGVLFDFASVVRTLSHCHPRLILANADGSDKWDRGEFYRNFRERKEDEPEWSTRGELITSESPGAFARVEGRYLEYFLRGISYTLGFVELVERPTEDRSGLDVDPPLDRIRAFRTTERLRQVLRCDPALDSVKVTVLPTFDVLVEAPSYPETTLAALEPFTKFLGEEWPVHRLKLDRERVVRTVADLPDGPDPAKVFTDLTGSPLPGNVAAELSAWTRRGGSAILYEGFGLLEIAGDDDDRKAALAALGSLVREESAGDFSLVTDPKKALKLLEETRRVPVEVRHSARRFAAPSGALAAASDAPHKKAKAVEKRASATLFIDDLVGLKSENSEFLAALLSELSGKATVGPEDMILLPVASLPELRAALRRLDKRFRVVQER